MEGGGGGLNLKLFLVTLVISGKLLLCFLVCSPPLPPPLLLVLFYFPSSRSPNFVVLHSFFITSSHLFPRSISLLTPVFLYYYFPIILPSFSSLSSFFLATPFSHLPIFPFFYLFIFLFLSCLFFSSFSSLLTPSCFLHFFLINSTHPPIPNLPSSSLFCFKYSIISVGIILLFSVNFL